MGGTRAMFEVSTTSSNLRGIFGPPCLPIQLPCAADFFRGKFSGQISGVVRVVIDERTAEEGSHDFSEPERGDSAATEPAVDDGGAVVGFVILEGRKEDG